MKIEVFTLPNGEDITLTAYLLDSSDEMPNMKTRPAVLVLPGGAYHGCSDREAEPVAMAFLAQGYHAFVLRYSVGPGKAAFPRPLEDAEAALELIRNRADEWKIKKDKIAAIGFSAGGHLAAALATMGRVRPNALILGYPCILESTSSILAEPVPSLDEYVDGKTPPTFIFASSEDKAVPIENSLAFAIALDKEKVPFEIHVFQKGLHGFSIANQVVSKDEEYLHANRFVKPWLDLCFKWLNDLFDFI
ncbi:MAG: alpha/beta hydrolase [Clostridiales bacterium]|nr:alpha/beta hydrolase [Clostridiales bacterium]